MGSDSADSADSQVRNSGSIEAVHNLGQSQVDRCGPLEVVKEQNNLHSGVRQIFNPWGSDGVVQRTFDFL
jgi:hypothetical protein